LIENSKLKIENFKQVPSVNYIQIIKNAWQIAWKNRFLWWFGLLVALGSPGGLNLNLNAGKDSQVDGATTQKVLDFVSQNMHWIVAGAIVLMLVATALGVIGMIARAGLIKAIDSVSKNKPAGFRAGMKEGKKYFWRLVGLGLIIFFLIIASILVLVFPVIFLIINKAYALAIFLGILAFLILIPVLILVSFLKVFGHLYIVLGELSMWNALEKAYELFQRNFLASIIMGLMFIPLGFIMMMAVLAVLIPLAIIFFAIGFGLYFAAGTPGAIITAGVGIIIFLILLFTIRSVYETFAQTVWYLFFLEIARPKVEETVSEEVLEKEEKVLPVVDPVKTMEIEK
jgi:hypothetical protein